ncbi:MAG: monooxygenase [Nevskia sp.]|nr:monooxygenase [Nevskia sp.]
MGLFKSMFGQKEAKFVEVAPFGARYEVPSGQTMLEAALANGVPFPHNCTVGTCGSCKCKLKAGRVNALTDFGYTLSQQEIAAGFILACQAIPRDALTQVEVESQALDAPAPEQFVGKLVASAALTHDIVRITVELDRPIRFIAGQYANLKYPNIRRARNYSFADAPDRDGRSSVSFFIRKVPGGAFTEDLFAGRLQNVPLDIEGPHGAFHLHPGSTPMICIAGGSGLAPLLSLLENGRKDRVKRPCAFLFGARTQADLYGLEQIQQIAASWADKFVFLPVLSHEPADSSWTGARGLVTQFITDAMPGIDWSSAEGYMCGPPGMIDAGIASMTEVGMQLDDIYYDKFTDESHIAKMP